MPCLGQIFGQIYNKVFAVIEAVIFKPQNGEARFGIQSLLCADERENILLLYGRRDYLLLFRNPADCFNRIPELCRFFIFFVFRRFIHKGSELFRHAVRAVRNEFERPLNVFVICGPADFARARRGALPDGIIETRAAFAVLGGEFLIAGRNSEYLFRPVNRRRNPGRAHIRAYVFCRFIILLFDDPEIGPFAAGDLYIAVTLVILEKDVVFGRMLFYKRAFKHERLKLGIAQDIIEIIDVFDHPAYLDGVIILRAEILADSVFESLCLADIDYLSLFVFHYIYARGQRKRH